MVFECSAKCFHKTSLWWDKVVQASYELSEAIAKHLDLIQIELEN